jgi:NAD(P)-dependent dehydrogenase (short-subunit alcohol dehydrogenase family)
MHQGMPAQPDEMLGRVVVITGAARGMGHAYTHAFLERGASVVGLDRSWDGLSNQSSAAPTRPVPAPRSGRGPGHSR